MAGFECFAALAYYTKVLKHRSLVNNCTGLTKMRYTRISTEIIYFQLYDTNTTAMFLYLMKEG